MNFCFGRKRNFCQKNFRVGSIFFPIVPFTITSYLSNSFNTGFSITV